MKNKRTTLKDFLQRAKEVHGEKYDYSKVVYTTTQKRVTIVCKEHGDFILRPAAHYGKADKRGCPKCGGHLNSKSGFYNTQWRSKPKKLYLVEIQGNGEQFLKVGVTTESSIRKRFQKGQLPKKYQINILFEGTIGNANNVEDAVKRLFSSFKYFPRITFRGSRECFSLTKKESILNFILKSK